MRTETIRRTTKTKAQSTAFEVLEELALTHELPRLVLEWRGLQKLKGTYIDALPQLVQSRDRPRAHLLQPGGRRDRTAEQQRSQPAEHPDPHRDRPRDPPRVRRRAGPRADLGRLLADRAARAGAPLRRADAASTRSRRARTSTIGRRAKVFGDDSGLSAHELRRRAKIINYALLYGKQAFTLAKDIGVSRAGGAGVHRRLLRRLPGGPRASSTTCSRRRAQTGVVKTMFGRRRLVPDLNNRNGQMRGARRARGRQPADPGHRGRHPQARDDRRPRARCRRVAGGRARMILTVHDELLFEAPKEAADETAARGARADGSARSR